MPGPLQQGGPNLHRPEGKPEEQEREEAKGEDRTQGGRKQREFAQPNRTWSIVSGACGAAAGTTAPRSPITQRYGNKVAGAGKMLWDSRELSLIPPDYNPVIDTPEACSVSFSTSSGDESSSGMPSDPSIQGWEQKEVGGRKDWLLQGHTCHRCPFFLNPNSCVHWGLRRALGCVPWGTEGGETGVRLDGPRVLEAQSPPAQRLADNRACAVQLLILWRQTGPWGFQRGRQASWGSCSYIGLQGS